MANPTENIAFSFTNLKVTIAGESLSLEAFGGISYAWKRDPQVMRGGSGAHFGFTDSWPEFDDATLTLFRTTYESVVNLFGYDSWLNAGRDNVNFTLVLSETKMSPSGQLVTLSRTLVGCTPVGDAISNDVSADATTVECKLRFQNITSP